MLFLSGLKIKILTIWTKAKEEKQFVKELEDNSLQLSFVYTQKF